MPNKSIVLGLGRCGSTLLIEALDQHPNLNTGLEPCSVATVNLLEFKDILKKFGVTLPRINNNTDEYNQITRSIEYWRELFKIKDCIKVLYGQIYHEQKLLDWIQEQNIYIVHLTRKNLLAGFVSKLVAHKYHVWYSPKGFNRGYYNPKVIIDLKELMSHINFTILAENHFNSFKNPILKIHYEDLVDNWDITITEIQKFLNVNIIKLNQTLEKLITEPISEIVTNYQEVIEYFKGSEYETRIFS